MKIVKNSTCSAVAALSLFVALLSSGAFSAAPPQYPDTMWVDVIFYDFHSDWSNPEFELGPPGQGLNRGMVDSLLDSAGLPKLGPTPYYNRRVDRWFREWRAGDITHRSIYNYYSATDAFLADRYGRYSTYPAGTITLPYDTSFTNKKLETKLPFLLIDNVAGTYQFANNNFFPLDTFGYKQEGRTHNYSYTMMLKQIFTKVPGLTFSFTGDDDVWAFVGNKSIGHKLRMDLGGIHNPESGSFSLDNFPDLKNDSAYTLSFFYAERHVVGSNIKITTNIVRPIIKIGVDVSPDTTICPFTTTTLKAVVTDNVVGLRPDLAAKTTWKIIQSNGQPDSVLKQQTGASVTFIATKAYSIVKIVATVLDDSNNPKEYTVTLNIVPCAPDHISIEVGPVNLLDTNALRTDQPHPGITITDNMLSSTAYAIARDRSGAYCGLADALTTQWSIVPQGAAIATATGTPPDKKYIGIVTRIGDGNTYVVANEPGIRNLRPDTAVVSIVPFYIVRYELRDALTGKVVPSIRMTTDDSVTYESWGLKSTAKDFPNDPNSWVKASAKWELKSDSITVVTPPPNPGQSWLLNPKTPGPGSLVLTNPTDPRTETLTIPVIIDPAPPSYVTIKLLTEAEKRIAGDTLLFAVKIFNKDSLVPGNYCFGASGDDPTKSVYRDTLGTGGGRHPNPTIRVESTDTLLNILNRSVYSVNQCFNGGIDTIKVVLFYAPVNKTDSTHQISVTLGGKMNASSEKFVLFPSDLDSLAIETVDFVPIPPQTLTGDGSVTTYADGYDRFGNRIGFIDKSSWSTTGTLTPKNEPLGPSSYTTAAGVKEDQQGDVCASAPSPNGSKIIKACVPVTIISPKKVVTSALTRDLNGNGRLDAIEIHFDRNVKASEIAASNFTNIFYNGSVQYKPTKVEQGVDSSTLILYLAETDTLRPQTNWLLYFNITASNSIGAATKVTTTDGAGPVVWRAVKNNRTGIVTVELSERVKNVNGSLITINEAPAALFNVYFKDRDTFIPVHVLDSVKSFNGIREDSVFIFVLPKGQDLSTSNFINLKVTPPLAQDLKSNKPHLDNVKRRVELDGQVEKIEVAPNPGVPSFTYTGPGSFNLSHSDQHWRWASEGQGVLIRVTITPDSAMSASLKIYDMAGNLVEYCNEKDFTEYLEKVCQCIDNQKDASKLVLDLYWNGSNHQGMKVSPGIYKIVFYLAYKNSKLSNVKLVSLIGIGK